MTEIVCKYNSNNPDEIPSQWYYNKIPCEVTAVVVNKEEKRVIALMVTFYDSPDTSIRVDSFEGGFPGMECEAINENS